MTLTELLIDPFTQYAFMRRALAACFALSVGGTPLGVFLSLRRMTLLGDAMSHALLPGVAIAFLATGLALWPLTIGGLGAGIVVALMAVLLTRYTQLKEDSAFSLLYLLSLAGGVTLVSIKSNSIDLLHLLFGNILAIDDPTLFLVAGASCVSLFSVAALYRHFVIEGFDPDFLKSTSTDHRWIRLAFFSLLMINLVVAFQALGALMALGLMILPAIAARFWTRQIDTLIPLSMAIALLSACIGLLASYHTQLPSGPAVVLAAGMMGLVSAIVGPHGSVRTYRSGR